MVYLVVGVVVVLLVYAIAKAATRNRYANTPRQSEEEAKRPSKVGAVVNGFQKIIDPGHRVEYAREQALRIEAETAESGDRPQTAPPQRESNNAAHSELERKIIEEG